jgi:DNA-binding NtrC family response regulator
VGNPSTQSESRFEKGPDRPVPGALLVFSGNAPMLRPFPVAPGPVKFGRKDAPGFIGLDDDKMSDAHAEVSFDGGTWTVKDLGTKNGSRLNGEKFQGGARSAPSGAVLRLGYSVFLLLDDVRKFQAGTVTTDDGYVVGPALKAQHDQIATAALGGAKTLLILGETGTGKEYAARLFHQHAAKSGPFVAFNSAGLEKQVADSELFGHVKGAFTGAVGDTKGLAHKADGGVLFLDEVGELDVELQAKLLRFVQFGEVRRVGSSDLEQVKLRIVSATNRVLERATTDGSFREDLYQRLADSIARLPPLRDRREEIPWIVDTVLREHPTVRQAHATFIEEALKREWRGNVRDLIRSVNHAARTAAGEKDDKIRDSHLPDAAVTARPPSGSGAQAGGAAPVRGQAERLRAMSNEEVQRAIDENGGKISRAATALDVDRTSLIRDLERRGLRNRAEPPGA